MSHQLIDLLDDLNNRMARLTSLVCNLVETAVDSVFRIDANLAHQAVEMDTKIDQEEVNVEKACIDLLALQQPAAIDLRTVITIIKVNADFERIADCAVNIAQRVHPLAQVAEYDPPTDMRLMANRVVATLRDTIRAFNMRDEELARKVIRSDDVIDALYHQIVQDNLALMVGDGEKVNIDLSNIMIAKDLERMADHCTNIAEDVIYIHTGRIIRHLRSL
jgi:phosphate transport system protein